MNLINTVITLAQQGKYPLLFIIYLIEGPVAGFISAFISASGSLNIYIVFLLLIIAEIGADVFYYYLGKLLSESELQKKLSKFDNNGFLQTVKEIFDKHPIKALIFIKVVGIIAVPSLIVIGKYQTIKPKKFILWTSIIALFKDLTIVLAGYTLGVSIEAFLMAYDIYKVIGIVISVLAVLYILFRINQQEIEKFTIKVLKKI
jgi:membrane-associated protein